MQSNNTGEGFECSSGCFSPEACINVLQIRALHVAREGLSSTIASPSTVETIETFHGDLASISTRSDHLRAQHAALYKACGLYQLEANGVLTDAVELEDMPPLD